ncbi:NlpC/P60 family protein [Flavobacterium sp. DG1-102-2]|uniref:NlpC/P60 family protein n=1 Tax=Flavobacterium sp. DG1-102-2 TaxID=3081663 RepID=UPI00294AE971|nr:NlpC/P60 family protein [Flavobacterium sp. DG1-102-2]
MINDLLKKTFLVGFTLILVSSCRSKNDFVITDDYVDKELGIKPGKDGKQVTLTETEKKYFALKLEVMPSEINNDRLYSFVKRWEGQTHNPDDKKKSVNDVYVTKQLYSFVYNKKLSGLPADMVTDKKIELFKATENLKEGDLLFFRLNDDDIISHVGVYLKNNRFFSAIQGDDAEIFNLKKDYWKNNFVTAGRYKQ